MEIMIGWTLKEVWILSRTFETPEIIDARRLLYHTQDTMVIFTFFSWLDIAHLSIVYLDNPEAVNELLAKELNKTIRKP